MESIDFSTVSLSKFFRFDRVSLRRRRSSSILPKPRVGCEVLSRRQELSHSIMPPHNAADGVLNHPM